jgi:hypothetical protein
MGGGLIFPTSPREENLRLAAKAGSHRPFLWIANIPGASVPSASAARIAPAGGRMAAGGICLEQDWRRSRPLAGVQRLEAAHDDPPAQRDQHKVNRAIRDDKKPIACPGKVKGHFLDPSRCLRLPPGWPRRMVRVRRISRRSCREPIESARRPCAVFTFG